MSILRPELTEMPQQIAALPTFRGYPVPWFVEWIEGEPEFRAMDPRKWVRAVQEKLCWICGRRLGSYLTFTIGPMCGITRTSSEPPGHLDCARWSARNCPFLAKPKMERREHEKFMAEEEARSPGGVSIKRNPGVTLLWITRSYEIWRPAPGEMLIHVGPPYAVEWWREGREATREEVEESVRTGLPLLEPMAVEEGEGAIKALRVSTEQLEELYPA